MNLMPKKKLIVIAGPTATGKSAAAIKLAKEIDGEIISADSIQVYRGMDIGSAKVTKSETEGVPHHLIDVKDISEDYNVAEFKRMAREALDGIYERNRVPIICGGTGFYIQALIYDIDFTDEEKDSESISYKNELLRLYDDEGQNALLELLKAEDLSSYNTLDHNNIKRIIRALEFKHIHGYSIQLHNEAEKRKRENPPYDISFFVLYGDRDRMYRRIDERVDSMVRLGLLDECKRLKRFGLNETQTAAQGIGYKEMLKYLDGGLTLEEAIYEIKKNSRHFAKRQLTWFKREKNAVWIDIDKGDTVNEIRKYL